MNIRKLFNEYCKIYYGGILAIGDEHTEELFQAFENGFLYGGREEAFKEQE